MSDDAEQESTDTEEVSRQELIEFLGDFMSGTMRIEQVYRSHLCATSYNEYSRSSVLKDSLR